MECECLICKEGLKECPHCGSKNLVKGTFREKGKKYPKYFCPDCQHRFIDVMVPKEKCGG